MHVVYKYPLQFSRVTEVELPAGSEVLSVQEQGKHLMVWVKQNTEKPKHKHLFVVAMTGESLTELLAQHETPVNPELLIHVSTLQDSMIGLVYHVFYTHERVGLERLARML